MRSEGQRRLFFALWPDEPLRDALVEETRGWVTASGGRPMRRESLHLTLAFLGNVDEGTARCVANAAAGVRGDPFELPFDRYGYFARPRAFWCGARVTPGALQRLVADLNTALRPCGIEPERRPYKAHLTLARKADAPKGEWLMQPLSWSVDEFVLVESLPAPEGVRYEVIGRWGLNGMAGDTSGQDAPRR